MLFSKMSRITAGPTQPPLSGYHGWSGWSMNLTSQWQVVPRFRMSGAIHQLLVLVLIAWTQCCRLWDKIWVLLWCDTAVESCLSQLLACHVPEHFTFCHRVKRYNVTAVQTVWISVWCHIVLRYLSARLSVMAFIRKSNICIIILLQSDFLSF
jgi:hypothetical protein